MDNEHMLLELDHISKIYGDLHAVDDLSLTVPQGQWLAIVGSSGSGKTTLMNMIGCMDTPSKGSVMLEGRRLEDLNARQLADVRKNMIGLVFQKFYLVPHLTAVENVMVAQYYHSVVDEKQAMEALERVGLKERAHHLPGQLSGGEQQRVCIARALINCPKLILADEPTGNLDEKNEKIVLDLFRQLHEQGTTIIVVTHDALVASCAQREIMLNHGVLVGEQWNDEEAKRAYEAAGGKPAFTGSAAEGAQNGGIAISFADPTKAAKTGDTDAANVAVAAGVADDTDVEPDVTKGEQACAPHNRTQSKSSHCPRRASRCYRHAASRKPRRWTTNTPAIPAKACNRRKRSRKLTARRPATRQTTATPPKTVPTRIPQHPTSRTPATTRMATIRSTASTGRSARTPSTCI